MTDRLAGSPWSLPETVRGFVNSPPNDQLMAFAARVRARAPRGRALDIGCGAGRNAIPLAQSGWLVAGTDLSRPMLDAAAQRARDAHVTGRFQALLAPMEQLPIRDRCCDLIVAHGIWNLARTAGEFRHGVREAARVAAPGARLFIFTFSRSTLPPQAAPVAGEPFVFTQFSGEPQCFLTIEELIAEMASAGFLPDPAQPVRELNTRPPGMVMAGPPVILEGGFVRAGA